MNIESARWHYGEFLAKIDSSAEIVALGFPRAGCWVSGDVLLGNGDIEYVQLTNVAPAAVRDKRFDIEGVEVQAVCRRMQKSPFALWHSHTQSVEPSETDLEFFPAHLVKYGAIFHAPSGQTTLYTGDGVFSRLPTTMQSARDTQ